MDELFGLPVAGYALTLAVIFAILAGLLIYIAARNTILVKMALRNVVRRPARGVLVVTGLMLATAIISIAFTTGDSVTFSIKNEVTEALRELDEFVGVDEESDVWDGGAVPDTFPESLYEQIGPVLEADPDVDATLPVHVESVAVANLEGQRFEVNAMFQGLRADRVSAFEALADTEGQPVDIGGLAPDEVYIDDEGAEALGAAAGDEIQVVLGEGLFVPFTVRGITDGYYWKRDDANVVVMTTLQRSQELLGAEGQLSGILVTNRGGPFEGEVYSDGILERLADTPAITDNGLELAPIKSDLVDLANEAGSLFVSFFTTFGLFSIAVGLLLIFLIFSMLAAERKSEMGIARAVGMQRRHLTRMFLTEGAIYGLGSAVIGTLIGVGLGYLLVIAASGLFSSTGNEDFALSGHASPVSALTSFLLGAVITLLTIYFASRRISGLNIVRAIRDIPDPPGVGRRRRNLLWGIVVTALGLLIAVVGAGGAQLPAMLFGIALVPLGASLILRWAGVSKRVSLSLAGLVLVIVFVLPASFWDIVRDDWTDNFASFFITGAFLVTGAVMLVMNNSRVILAAMVNTVGLYRRLTPVVKSAVAYPLRFGFRTGLSVAMFAVVVYSVVVMSVLIEGFNDLFDNQERLAGGYDVYGFAQSDLNPVTDLRSTVQDREELSFVSRIDGRPEVGTFRTVFAAEGVLPDHAPLVGDIEYQRTNVTGIDPDFFETNSFGIELATAEYLVDGEFDSRRLWDDLEANPGLAVVDAQMIPTRNNFQFDLAFERLILEAEGLYIENETMDPVRVTVRDLESGSQFDLTVVGVLDALASTGPVPLGLYTSSEFLTESTGRDLDATQFFFKVEPGTDDPGGRLETALFEHGVETLDIAETLEEFQGSQRSFFDLLLAFMLLGLVVGIAALGVISARAVVERRHGIGVMRAVGFSRAAVLLIFLAESSFIALLGIAIGLALGILTGVNIIADVRSQEPDIQLLIPWSRLVLIVACAYLFSLATTLLPARQASQIAPAEALRYE